MSVSDQNFNSIFQVDALFGYMTVSLVLPAKLAFVLVRLCRHLFREPD
ncbi:hypothetical protein A2U01_0105937, partial [Trifolium medium]|nr:hypothetical protein [Trifolium medium]